jgi:hypothetical protein
MPRARKQTAPARPCPVCRAEMRVREIHVVQAECWRDECNSPMKVAFGGEEGYALGPDDFTDEEIAAARAAGAKLEVRESKTVGASYMANVCPSCDVITGSFYLHDYWHLARDQDRVLSRLSCDRCEGREKPTAKEPVTTPTARPPALLPESFSTTPELRPKKAAPRATAPTSISAWGTCGHCHTPACPRIITAGRFYCPVCKGQRAFLPDAKP